MGLTFPTAASSVVDLGSPAGLDGLANSTTLVWANYGASMPGNRALVSKQTGTGTGYRIFNIRATGQLNAEVEYSGTNATCRSADSAGNRMEANTWHFMGMTHDDSQGTHPVDDSCQLYIGDRNTLITEVSYATAPNNATGGLRADGGKSTEIGNVPTFSIPFPGSIAWVGIWNYVMTVAEMQRQQFNPHVTDDGGCLFFAHLGWQGTSTVTDWSDYQHNASAVTNCSAGDHAPIMLYGGFDVGEFSDLDGAGFDASVGSALWLGRPNPVVREPEVISY